MTLPFLVVLLAIVFFLLKMSGLLDEWAEASRRPRSPTPGRRGSPLEKRLDIFREFIDQLPSGEDDEQRR